jgi:hypothetical protein
LCLFTPSTVTPAYSAGNQFSASSSSAGTTWSPTVGATLNAGELAVCALAYDNITTSDGDGGLFSANAVTDSKANTWIRQVEFTNGQGVAQGGVTVAIFTSKLQSQLVASTDTISISTGASSITSKALTCRAFIGPVGSLSSSGVPQSGANDGAGNPLTLSMSGLTPGRDHIFVRAVAKELPATGVLSTATNGWTKNTTGSNYTTLGTANLNVCSNLEFIISNSTSASSRPAMSGTNGDMASLMIALE